MIGALLLYLGQRPQVRQVVAHRPLRQEAVALGMRSQRH